MFKIPTCLIKPKNRQLIIALEGVDGCGKTTLCEKLEEYDERILFSRIPSAYTQRPFKDYLAFSTSHVSSALIYAASLVDRMSIINNKKDNYLAITDRSIWSTIVLLYARQPEVIQEIINVYASVSRHITIPDVVYVLDVHFSVCQERIREREDSKKIYDDMMLEEYNKHLECYHLLKKCGVNIKFIQTAQMTYDDEVRYILGDLFNEK